jgi:hypothetical protein
LLVALPQMGLSSNSGLLTAHVGIDFNGLCKDAVSYATCPSIFGSVGADRGGLEAGDTCRTVRHDVRGELLRPIAPTESQEIPRKRVPIRRFPH